MKIHMDVEISAEDVRKLLGLPDVAAFQQDLLDQVRDRMVEGVEGYDPLKLFQPYLTSAYASWDALQKVFGAAMQSAASPESASQTREKP